jgi:low temperature requirement protein LtrA
MQGELLDVPQGPQPTEHRVSPLELFFDLVFAFAFTQVTGLLLADPGWLGVLRGMLVLAALWWAWNVYAWLSSAMDVDEGGVRLTILATMGALMVAALAVPRAFGADAVLFAFAYLLVRLLHLVLSAVVARDDADRRSALLRFAPTSIVGPSLIVAAGFLNEGWRIAVWIVALAIDYLGPVVVGMGRGWLVAAEHFAERYGLIVLVALGESIIAIGIGAGPGLTAGALAAVVLGVALVSALWWLYFDVAAILTRSRLAEASGLTRARLARDSYGYFHWPMVAGIVLFAFGLETSLHHLSEPLDLVPAVALCGGTSLYLLGQVAFLFRATGYVFRRRTIASLTLLVLIPVSLELPALASLAVVSGVCALLVAYEALRHRAARLRLRHPAGGASS